MERPADKYREIKHLGRLVADMVHGAPGRLRAPGRAGRASRSRRKIRLVDEEYEAIQRQCITFMMEDPRTIRRALDVLWVARALERIGDHAKNICEYVVYMVHGKDIRHLSIDEVEKHHAIAGAKKSESRKSRSGQPVAARMVSASQLASIRQRARSFSPAPASWAIALYAQYVLGLQPCPLCIFQRIATIVTGILFLIATIHNPRGHRRSCLRRADLASPRWVAC